MSEGHPILLAEGISKAFVGVQALRDVTIEVHAGKVLALIGENGAGKSTLLKILSGDYKPDAGHLLIDGERVEFGSTADARRSGIRVIAQEPEIIPHVSVAENIHVGELPRRGRLLDRRRLMQRTRDDLDRYGFGAALDPSMVGSRLSPAQRQLVEIMRALAGETKVIALDEPTSSLSDHEVESLFRLLRRLRDDGVALLYVSHRMAEMFELADRITVLRDGAVVGSRDVRETSEQELVHMMVGRDLSNMFVRKPHERGPVMLSVRGVSNEHVHDVSFDVHAGEVVALAGLVGAGRSELARAIAGGDAITSGHVEVAGRPVKLRSPRDAIRAGLGLAPEERKAQALLLQRSVRDNVSLVVLNRLSRAHFIRRGRERELAQRFVRQLNIRTPSIEHPIGELSGGNQQKAVLARWLARRPKVLVLDEPTRGVDVGAKAEIYGIISELAADGIALLVISSELPEVLGLADRIIVMQSGRVTGELARDNASEESILALAMSDELTGSGAQP